MHIVQALVSLNIGGSERVATELSEYQVGKGNKVTIIAADSPHGSLLQSMTGVLLTFSRNGRNTN
jgi:hypothetical protein